MRAACDILRPVQLKPVAEIFQEGGHEWQQHWRSRRTVIYSRSETAGVTHSFYAYSVLPVNGAEERDILIASDQNLDRLIDVCDRWEIDH
jgi:hypothetical protein